jgi:serpin B
MKNVINFLSILVSIFLFSCDGNLDQEENIKQLGDIPLSNEEIQLMNDGQKFAMNLFSVVHEQEADKENIVLSPLSLNMALAMVWNGAKNETKQAIQKAMGMEDFQEKDVNEYFKKVREYLYKADPTIQLALANSIWTRKGFSVIEDFYTVNKQWYNAEVQELDFSDPTAPSIINHWCADNTDGLIKEMIQTIPDDAKMYLLNALYFKGEWSDKNRFNESITSDALFKKENGESVTVKMMNQRAMLSYYNDKSLSMVSLPYGNDTFSMLFILPNENLSFNALTDKLKQPKYWNQCLNARTLYDVNLYLPKFKVEYEITLNETLQQLGMGIAFSPLQANFSGISTDNLVISKVRQKSSIEINERGSEAAAVTVVEIEVTAGAPSSDTPKEATFRADRPFLFAIQENSTGIILFMGKIGNPE